MRITHTIHDNTELRREHGPGIIQLVESTIMGDIDLELELERYNELPIAAHLACELLHAAGDCETSDEALTREVARGRLLELAGLVHLAIVRLDEADAIQADDTYPPRVGRVVRRSREWFDANYPMVTS